MTNNLQIQTFLNLDYVNSIWAFQQSAQYLDSRCGLLKRFKIYRPITKLDVRPFSCAVLCCHSSDWLCVVSTTQSERPAVCFCLVLLYPSLDCKSVVTQGKVKVTKKEWKLEDNPSFYNIRIVECNSMFAAKWSRGLRSGAITSLTFKMLRKNHNSWAAWTPRRGPGAGGLPCREKHYRVVRRWGKARFSCLGSSAGHAPCMRDSKLTIISTASLCPYLFLFRTLLFFCFRFLELKYYYTRTCRLFSHVLAWICSLQFHVLWFNFLERDSIFFP